jgi:pimeloyl-ACP methyl ester carboxylesterase
MRPRLLLAAAMALGVARTATAQSIVLSPCRVPNIDADIRCGTYVTHEDPDDPRSRAIPLAVMIVPSRSATPLPDPVVFVSPGGPGTTNSEGFVIAAWYSWMRDHRDIIVVDLRGTSGPSRLDCDMSRPALGAAEFLSTLFPKDKIDACRDALGHKADLRFYTTPLIVRDFDDVRRALGYEKLNLYGVSWGTRIEYLWLRMHPETVRSAILEGTAPVSVFNPITHARTAQEAIDALFAECRRQTACHESFPNVRIELDSVLARLKRAPASVRIARAPGDTVVVPFTWQQFAEALRLMTYSAPRSLRVPLLVHRAFEGDYAEFANAAIQSNRQTRATIRFGFLLSVTCTEDVSRIDPRTIGPETAGTYLGDSRVREQMAACRDWPRGAMPKNYGDPVRSNLPVFLLSGSVDPVAPARYTQDAARYLPNSIHVVAPGGHVPRGPCIDAMERQFLEAASATAVDTSCVAAMRLPEFMTPPAPTSVNGSDEVADHEYSAKAPIVLLAARRSPTSTTEKPTSFTPDPLAACQRNTNRSGSRFGSGRKSVPRTTLNIAVFAPRPSASVPITVAANPGDRRRTRMAKRMSLSISFIQALRIAEPRVRVVAPAKRMTCLRPRPTHVAPLTVFSGSCPRFASDTALCARAKRRPKSNM